jgi:hypothetical protein
VFCSIMIVREQNANDVITAGESDLQAFLRRVGRLLAANVGRVSQPAPSYGFIDRAREKQSRELPELFLPNRNLT